MSVPFSSVAHGKGGRPVVKIIALALALALAAPSLASGLGYRKEQNFIGGRPETVYTIEADLRSGKVVLQQALSFDLFYGIEGVSSMAGRYDADVAVNGMFYNYLGSPAGIMIVDGKPISTRDIGAPSVMVSTNGEVAIGELEVSSEVIVGGVKMKVSAVNDAVYDGQTVLFTQEYGKSTRVRRYCINYCIKDGRLKDITRTDKPVMLDGYDYILTTVGKSRASVSVGDPCIWQSYYADAPFDIDEAFQTGGWLLKDGVIALKPYESYIGPTNALAPRTLAGVNRNGELVLVVVDGRNPGISEGITGLQAAQLMLDAGCTDAAFLDGGASSTLVLGGKVANVPSGGEERGVAHSILLTRAE